MRKINYIWVHNSWSIFGGKSQINQWHLDRGWSQIGYNYVINNGIQHSNSKYDETYDGLVEVGRDIKLIPAMVKGHNKDGIGICLIGKTEFTKAQLHSLIFLIHDLMEKYNVPVSNILGHYEADTANGKTCPNFNCDILREIVSETLSDLNPLLFPYDKDKFNFV